MKATTMTAHELTCQELVELVTDYLEGALSPSDYVRFEAHLAICRHCSTYLAQMRRTIQVLGRLTEESLEPATRDDLLQLFRHWKQQPLVPVNHAAS